jgi:hypothetical protein
MAPGDLAVLECLKRLEVLILRGVNANDLHLAHLPALPNLRMIDIQETAVSKQGVEDVQSKCPNAKIYSDYS